MGTVFDCTPSMEMTTGTALPFAAPGGTRALTWYKPTYPGVSPEKETSAAAPPIIALARVAVSASGLPGAGAPVAGWWNTGPRPVQKICTTVLPALAGWAPSTSTRQRNGAGRHCGRQFAKPRFCETYR